MRRALPTLAILAVLVLASSVPARAEGLIDALTAAYETNPTIQAQRARLRATDEGLPQSLAGWRPTVTLSGETGRQRYETNIGVRDRPQHRDPTSASVIVSQPLYRGGRTVAGSRRARNLIEAERARLTGTEQGVLLDAATAFVDVVRDQAVLKLNAGNEQVLRRNLEATRDRFEVGEVTRTDVSQAESRLERATAERIRGEGALASSRAVFENVVGSVPGVLETPEPLADLPETRVAALSEAAAKNPNVVLAQFSEQAARDDVDVTTGELLPVLSLDGSISRAYDTFARASQTDSAKIAAVLTVPLYQAGAVSSRVRQSKQVAGQRRVEVEVARRDAVEGAARTWEALQTARAQIVSIEAQIRASDIALTGVREEAAVGARTVLDVLDAEQELLDARSALVRARRDEIVAGFQLRAAVGRLTARNLGLPVAFYDVEAHFKEVRGMWWGLSSQGE
ncbi:MAG: TolC family outer membrane protein [Alphaproteobacteria bacterium]